MTVEFHQQNNIGEFTFGSRPQQFSKKTGVAKVVTKRGMVINSLLRKDEWEELDRAALEEAHDPLTMVGDLFSRGLVRNHNSIGTQASTWNTVSEMTPAGVDMRLSARGERDRAEFDLTGVPLPVIWKEFEIEARELEASRRLGESLDTIHVREATRVVNEGMETLLASGNALQFGGYVLQGYTNFDGRLTDTAANYGGGSWGTSIDNIVDTVAGMINALHLQNHFGPFVVYASTTQYNLAANSFYTDGSGQTPMDRIMRLSGVADFRPSSPTYLADGNVLAIQMTRTVVDWAQVWSPRVIEWVTEDQSANLFRVLAIGAPRLKKTYGNRVGICHATGAA